MPVVSFFPTSAMALLTPDESLMYAALAFESAVLQTEQSAIVADVRAIELRVAHRETRLAMIRCLQAQNQLAQAIQKLSQQKSRSLNS